MSLQEYTVNKDTGHVPEAHVDMGRGQVDEIERQAKATVTTAKEEGGRVTQAESQIAGAAHGSSESKLYGDIAAEASGLKVISTVADFLGDTLGRDPAKNLGGMAPATARSADDFFGISKSPGVYRAPATPSVFGAGNDTGAASNVTPLRRSSDSSAGLLERSSISSTSLRGQDEAGSTSTWTGVERRMNSVQEAKRMTFGQELASEKALESVQRVRQEHSAQLGQAQQYSPSMGLGSGPSIRPNELLSEARDNYVDQTSAAGA